MSETTSYYDNYWDRAHGWTPADVLDAELARWLRPLAVEGRRVLDVGCGDGERYAQALVAAGVELHGVDPSQVAVERARAVGIDAAVGDATRGLDHPDASFDGVVCFEVLEHLFLPARAVAEMYRVLKPGGTLIASVPNVGHWRNRCEHFLLGRFQPGGSPDTSRDAPWRDPHIRFFNKRSFRALFVEAGFEIERQGGLDTQPLGACPGLRRLVTKRWASPLTRSTAALGRTWYTLLSGRCVLRATKPNAGS